MSIAHGRYLGVHICQKPPGGTLNTGTFYFMYIQPALEEAPICSVLLQLL